MKKRLFVVIALVAGLAACSTGGKSAAGEGLTTDSIGAERADSIASVKIHIAYPTQGPAALVDSLRHFIARTLQDGAIFEPADSVAEKHLFEGNAALVNDGKALLAAAVQHEYDRLKADRDEMVISLQGDIAVAQWPAYESVCDISLLHEADTYVTLVVNRYEFLGGAHGSAFVEGNTFSKSDGRRLGWALLKDTNSPAFQALIRKGLRQYFQDASNGPVADEQLGEWLMLPSDAEQIPLPAVAPYLTADGVAFIYQQYEIAPYAAGLPSFTVSYADIQPFLSPAAQTLLPKGDK